MNHGLHVSIKGSYSSNHLCRFWNYIGTDSRMNCSHRNNSSFFSQFRASTNQGLDSINYLRRNHDGINTVPWSRTMRLFSTNNNFIFICCSHNSFSFISYMPYGCSRIYMQPKNSINIRIFKHTFFDHQQCSTFFTSWRSFFGRLKNEFYRSSEIPIIS